MQRTPLIAGNWKMNGTPSEALNLIEQLKTKLPDTDQVEILVCPPFVALPGAVRACSATRIGVGAQNVHGEDTGAFTGEVSAPMLVDTGVTHAIIGHSERRQYYAETDESVNQRLHGTLNHGLTPIVCVGETLQQRESDRTETVVSAQLQQGLAGLSADQMAGTVIAYEPVWAIGTGHTATPEQAQAMHAYIRNRLTELFDADTAQQVRILYGGSVKAANAADLLTQTDIDGALVGGASLKPDDFADIVRSVPAQ